MDLPISRAVVEAVQTTVRASRSSACPRSAAASRSRSSARRSGAPTITVPIANYDNNQHAENENIRLQNLWDGIETYAALLTMRFSRQ